MSRMASPNPIRTRSERVASLQLEPSALQRQLTQLLTGQSLLQLLIAAVTVVILVVVLQGWLPPFAYREGQIPERDIVARVAFDLVDVQQTKMLRDQRRRETLCYYENRPQPINQLRSALKDQMFALLREKSFTELTPEQLAHLNQFAQAGHSDQAALTPEAALGHLRALLSDSDQINRFGQVPQSITSPIAESGY